MLTVMAAMTSLNAVAGEGEASAPSLYDRLGAMDGITQIVTDTVALHHENSQISHFFDGVDDAKLIHHVAAFFAAGTGGPANYEGRDMASAHASMSMTDADFDSAVADVLKSCESNGIAVDAQSEVDAILESLRPAVMGTATE